MAPVGWGDEGPGSLGSQRWQAAESLDGQARQEPASLAQNLDDLARIKHWLRYDAEVWRAIWAAWQGGARGPLTVLDAATGGADVPVALARRAVGAGLLLRVLAVDVHPQVVRMARRRSAGIGQVAVARADALRLPLAAGGIDLALCSFALHHFAPEQARRLLAELARVARLGLIVSDLARSRPAYWAAWSLAHLFTGPRHGLTRRDGPLSARRAYTPAEVRALAAAAGLREPVVLGRRPFRLALLAPAGAFGL